MVGNLIYSIIPVISLVVGIYIGYKLRGDGGKDKLPDIKSPVQVIKEHKEKVELEKELEETKDWIEKVNNYNGEFGDNEQGRI